MLEQKIVTLFAQTPYIHHKNSSVAQYLSIMETKIDSLNLGIPKTFGHICFKIMSSSFCKPENVF